MAGYLIAALAFALPFVLGLTGLGRTRMTLGVGGFLAVGALISLAMNRPENERGDGIVPLWFLVGLVALLYAIWCGGLWLGVRFRRMRRATPG